MMIQNAKQTSFCQAVQRTFDGGHPCSLCHVVNKGNASGQKHDAQAAPPKIDIICVARTIRLLPIFAFFEYAPGDFSFLKMIVYVKNIFPYSIGFGVINIV